MNYIGIRPGEKIHEEMVSLEESLRTKIFEKYFMITDYVMNEEAWSFASNTVIMEAEDVEEFLREKEVIK